MQTATNAIKPNIKTQRLIDFDVAPEIDPLTFKVPKTRAKLMQVEVTPDLAQVFLATQVENRRLKGSTVEAYARNLQRGDFPYNPSAPLMFDTQGRLFDGQHRLQAVIESGVALVADLDFGLNPDIRHYVDAGTPRKAGEQYGFMTGNLTHANLIAARTRTIGLVFNSHRSKHTVSDIDTTMAEFGDGVKLVNSLCPSGRGIGRAGVAAAFAIAGTAFPVKTKALLEEIIKGQTTTKAAQVLHAYIYNNGETQRRTSALNAEMVANKVLYGIKKHFENAEFERLQSKKGEVLDYFTTAIVKRIGDAPTCSAYLATRDLSLA
jgi:hypothetical protein